MGFARNCPQFLAVYPGRAIARLRAEAGILAPPKSAYRNLFFDKVCDFREGSVMSFTDIIFEC